MTMHPMSGNPASNALVAIGRVWANDRSLVTPVGTFDLRDVTVTAYDQSREERFIPGWAIVMTIITFFFFFLGLLFLLVRDTRVSGHVVVQFSTGTQMVHAEHIPIGSQYDRDEQFRRVSFLQSLIGSVRARG